ncbi:CaiB/BaiF CoA transferase family protein [Xylophilus sp. ASV27]|uniref:CaiB/BaiF CoA transferase family protein n=1 Tax=Xylophilus sp. ASV27 TaxID=2795129 RepID=UPI0018EA4562|nr:CoA transferase [Xylophilus sp. ASV27]
MKVGDIAHPERIRFGKPLEGVRILALEQAHAMPFATQLMARLGADVVRIEPPDTGEQARNTYPAARDPEGRLLGSTFLRNNLNKRSITIDIKNPEGRDLVLRLAGKFDVFAENFRGGALQRAGLGYEAMAALHPRIIYASISGFGTDGRSPYHGRAAFAPIVEAISAFYDFKRTKDERPQVGSAGALGDTASGLYAVIGILSALRHRDRIGTGQHVDIAMYDVMVSMVDVMMSYASMGKKSTHVPTSLTAAFKARDGFFILMCNTRQHFVSLAQAVGCPQWLTDPRLETSADWGAQIDALIRPEVERWASAHSHREAAEILGRAGIAVAPCQSIQEVMQDPHVIARNMVVELERPDGVPQPACTPGNPVKMSRVAEGPERRVPWVGEHTGELLARELALDTAQIERLRDFQVIG